MSIDPIRAAVIGATGYTGAELLRLLHGHPRFSIGYVAGHSTAGEPIAQVLPSFLGILDGVVEPFDAEAIAERADVAFCALPHGASAPSVDALREKGLVVFDLSADFRLADLDVYAEWYGEHGAPHRHPERVYGLVELNREAIASADLVAVPGCYPTAAILALAPILEAGLAKPAGIVIDAKSGVSGAGRKPSPKTHLPEAAEGIRAYKVGSHRHTPEIDQELGRAAGTPLKVLFTPHLVPMTRGILITAYADAAEGATVESLTAAARERYAGSPSVVVLDPGQAPDTLWIRGSNRVHLGYALDQRSGKVIAMGTVDNLVKGAAGQAIQAANVRFDLPEGMGLEQPAAWP